MTAKTLDFVIYASAVKYKDTQEVYSKIRQILKPLADTKKNNITRKLILMELN
jgi:deoxyribose-phosphate aldolase